jgi:molybdopterin-guanine dinucleotide biosynthesis protein A
MLMVGAGDRNAGKTKFACSLIKKFSSHCDIIGIKVTMLEEAEGSFHRPSAGCDVCSSVQDSYCIAEETNSRINKDSAEMLASGAKQVYWLQVWRTHPEEGIDALLDIIRDDAVSVCESNSLRRFIEPGLFVMVKSCGEKTWKPSAKNVAQYVDRTVIFDGNEFDIGLDAIEFKDGMWITKMKATAIIMAGGDSTRTGRDKSMLPIMGEPMIKHICDRLRPHFDQILIGSGRFSKYSFLGLEVIPDRAAGKGPLMGIASTLRASANEVNFVIACDIPQVDMDVVRAMVRQVRGYDAVVPTTGQSQYEPLFAVYKKDILAAIEDALSSGHNRIIDTLSRCRVKFIDLTAAQWLKNINTMDDYLQFIRKNKSCYHLKKPLRLF